MLTKMKMETKKQTKDQNKEEETRNGVWDLNRLLGQCRREGRRNMSKGLRRKRSGINN